MRREYTYEDYHRVMKLLNKGLGPTEVSRMLDIPKCTVKAWKYRRGVPWLAKWYPEPSNELAYVIGVLLGDGCIVREHHNDYDIILRVKDYEFAEEFSRNMAKILNKKFKKPRRWSGRPSLWIIYYHSKAFHTWFRKQTLDTLKPYMEYDEDTVKYFLRGIYDSEGCNYRCKRIILYNSDLKLLNYVRYLLKKYFGIMIRGPYLHVRAGSIHMRRDGEEIRTKNNNYYIGIYRMRNIQVFLSEIGFSIAEKQLGLPRRKKKPKPHPHP